MNNKKFKKLKIAVAMSGGVDSSVAAKLLVDQGHEVVGIFLHFWKEEQPPLTKGGSPVKNISNGARGDFFENRCCSAEALLDARRVADKIGIPLYTLNFAKIFKKQVVDNFLSEYGSGKTPNPCVICNKSVKLGYLLKEAQKLGFDYVASGHYVKKLNNKLYKAKDKDKDQSYFLYTFSQDELKHLLFPLAGFTKPEVRQMAKKFKLPVAEKTDSQEICFIPGKSHNDFLMRHLKLKPGPIKTLEGKIVGSHLGLPLYTIGQRKGINIGGTGPFYVAGMDYKKNILYVVNDRNDKNIFKDELIAGNVNWLSGRGAVGLTCDAVIRYRHKPVKCRLVKINEKEFAVKFREPQRAIAPGQSVVFYKGGEVLGGGIIK